MKKLIILSLIGVLSFITLGCKGSSGTLNGTYYYTFYSSSLYNVFNDKLTIPTYENFELLIENLTLTKTYQVISFNYETNQEELITHVESFEMKMHESENSFTLYDGPYILEGKYFFDTRKGMIEHYHYENDNYHYKVFTKSETFENYRTLRGTYRLTEATGSLFGETIDQSMWEKFELTFTKHNVSMISIPKEGDSVIGSGTYQTSIHGVKTEIEGITESLNYNKDNDTLVFVYKTHDFQNGTFHSNRMILIFSKR